MTVGNHTAAIKCYHRTNITLITTQKDLHHNPAGPMSWPQCIHNMTALHSYQTMWQKSWQHSIHFIIAQINSHIITLGTRIMPPKYAYHDHTAPYQDLLALYIMTVLRHIIWTYFFKEMHQGWKQQSELVYQPIHIPLTNISPQENNKNNNKPFKSISFFPAVDSFLFNTTIHVLTYNSPTTRLPSHEQRYNCVSYVQRWDLNKTNTKFWFSRVQ